MSNTVSGIFKTAFSAKAALARLETMGIRENQVSIVATDDTIGNSFEIDRGNKSDEGGLAGAATGGVLGAIAAGIASVGGVVIPGVNLVIYGLVVSAAAGAGVGAAAGGLIGALIGAGIPEYEAKIYEDKIKKGSVLVVIKARTSDEADSIKDVFKQQHAEKIAA